MIKLLFILSIINLIINIAITTYLIVINMKWYIAFDSGNCNLILWERTSPYSSYSNFSISIRPLVYLYVLFNRKYILDYHWQSDSSWSSVKLRKDNEQGLIRAKRKR